MSWQSWVEFTLNVFYDGPRRIEDGNWMGAVFSHGSPDNPPWQFSLTKRFPITSQDVVDLVEPKGPERLFNHGLRQQAQSIVFTLNLQPELDGHYKILGHSLNWSFRRPNGKTRWSSGCGITVSTGAPPIGHATLPSPSMQFDYAGLQATDSTLQAMLKLYDVGRSLRGRDGHLALLNFLSRA